jgi:hypothetical protein
LNEQLQNPIVQADKKLRLWCLIAKGNTDIEIDYRASKRDWLEAQELAKSLGEDQWETRASGELGLIGFLEGNPGRAARLLGGALLSTMTNGDTAGQVRFLELLGRGFEEVNRHSEALKFFERAIKLAEANPDCGLPFMGYEGKAQALVSLGKTNEAKVVLENALTKARSQEKRGHEAQLLILLGKLAAQKGILTAQEAIHLVSQHVGVAIVTKPASVGLSIEGVVMRPLSDPSLSFETCLIMRADEDSRLANDFGRSFLQKCAPRRLPPMQLNLPLPA